MALTMTTRKIFKEKSMTKVVGTLAFDTSYPTDGESFATLLSKVVSLSIHPYKGYMFEPDYTNKKIKAYRTGAITPEGTLSGTNVRTAQTISIIDSDAAAATGVELYFHVDEIAQGTGVIGHLEFVSPTNASGHFKINSTGPTVRVRDDDDAATGGLALYFDEDAATVDQRILVDLDLPGDQDCFVVASDGSMIRLKDTDTPETPGVLIYFDEDAANAHERLLFVSPTNANGTGATDDQVGMQVEAWSGTLTGSASSQAALAEVTDTTNLSTLSAVPFEATLWR